MWTLPPTLYRLPVTGEGDSEVSASQALRESMARLSWTARQLRRGICGEVVQLSLETAAVSAADGPERKSYGDGKHASV